MLTALHDDVRVYAAKAEKGPGYRCPGCAAALVLRKGDVRIHHFAHRPEESCAWGAGETEAHLAAKLSLYEAFRDRSLRAEAEWIVPQLAGDRRADLFIWEMGAGPVAIELQHSAISAAEIAARSESYMAAGIAVVWLPFLSSADLEAARASGDMTVPRYVPRPFERWVQAFGRGPLWYWSPADASLYRAAMKPCMVWREGATWTDEQGIVEAERGHWVRLPRCVSLALEGPFEPRSLVLRRYRRKPAQTGRNRLPGGPAAALELAGGR